MSGNWEEITDQFDARSEGGQRYRVLVYTTMIDARTLSNPKAAPLPGLKRFCTSDGDNCNRIDDDTFEIVGLGLRLTRDRRRSFPKK